MEALQYIYTSWKNGDSTEKGYMIYSRSEGITDAECTVIKDAMQYLAPKELTLTPTPQEIEDTFPYSFSYFILPTGRGCVAQSTYLGKDYSGRYGNYIIYALVFNIDELPCRPAELFAESYIKNKMTQEELDAPSPVPPLPLLTISSYSTVINDEQLSEFLYDKEEEFAQLISMILSARDNGIPFYLNDTRENLVLWAAAVQRMLPSRLAKKFIFNTYVGDHESMRSTKARDEGLNFHLIGVRPDANYFNYATESMSNRQIVMDFIGGNMTQGITANSYSLAMAESFAFDFEDIDSFGEFVDSTTFDEINGHLQDAFLYYKILKNDEFEFNEDDLKAVLLFGSDYCSEADNSDVGSKLLMKCQEGGWQLNPELLKLFWAFISRYSSFMIFSLYELFTEMIYNIAADATEPCKQLDDLIISIKTETPRQYSEYLEYMNSAGSVDQMILLLSGNSNQFTNSFYIKWLLQDYPFNGGLSNGQPVSKLLQILLKNIMNIRECEKLMIEILIETSDNQNLFKNILSVFNPAFSDRMRLEQLCEKYVEVTESMSDNQLNHFEHLLLETPEAGPIAANLCAKKIARSKNPKDEFWRFYDNQRSRIVNSGFPIDQLILACVRNVEEKNRDTVSIEILSKIDESLINDSEAIRLLTDYVNDSSIKALSKMDSAFLQKVGRLRAKVDDTGLDKIGAVFIGEYLGSGSSRAGRPLVLSDELSQANLSLISFDKSEYEAYLKNYFMAYFSLLQSSDDISVLMKTFYHDRYFSDFVDDYISAVKKLAKKENDRWKRILCLTCSFIQTSDRSNRAAEEMYKPVIRYLRSLDQIELAELRLTLQRILQPALCESLFVEVKRKEGIAEKFDSIFRRKEN